MLTVRFIAASLFLAVSATATAVDAALVTALYEARAATVTGTPFGLTVPLNTIITGYITYNTDTPDSAPALNHGRYLHTTGGGFEANVLGTIVSGSPTPEHEVVVQSTFRIWDGPTRGGIMSLNGVPDPDVNLFMVVVPHDTSVLPTDELADPFFDFSFGVLGDPHTFQIQDDQGGILMQINEFTPLAGTAVPEPSTYVLAAMGLLGLALYGQQRRRS